MPKITFVREGGFPKGATYITCSHSEFLTVEALTMEEAWRLAELAGEHTGGQLILSGYHNNRADWEAITGEPSNPKHHFRDDDLKPGSEQTPE